MWLILGEREQETNRKQKMKKRQRERNRQGKRNLSVVCAGREGGKRDVDSPMKECLQRETKQIEDETINVFIHNMYAVNPQVAEALKNAETKNEYVTILFSSQYDSSINISSNTLSINKLGPRYFNLTVSGDSPITISL